MNLPGVSVIITAYSPKSKPYLDLCVDSVKRLAYDGPLETIVVAPHTYAPAYEGVRTISPPEETYGCPRGLNFGIAAASHEYVYVLNDDVIVTMESLAALMGTLTASPKIGILMPIGNDQQMRYHYELPVIGPYRIEKATKLSIDHLSASTLEPLPRVLAIHDTLCIYAYLMRKSVHDSIGGFDEKLIAKDDIDFCIRLRHKGFINAIAMNAVVWHSMGATSEWSFTEEMRARGEKLFAEKWGGA